MHVDPRGIRRDRNLRGRSDGADARALQENGGVCQRRSARTIDQCGSHQRQFRCSCARQAASQGCQSSHPVFSGGRDQ